MSEENNASRSGSESDEPELPDTPPMGITLDQLINGLHTIEIINPTTLSNNRIQNNLLSNDGIVSVNQSSRSESPLSDVFENDAEERAYLPSPPVPPNNQLRRRCRPITIWRQWVNSYSSSTDYNRAHPNDPLGPYTIPRITRNIPGGLPDRRYYEFPHGNENIGDTPLSELTPEWHAWAGWLGPRAFFRVRWGAAIPTFQSYVMPELPRRCRNRRAKRARFIPGSVKPQKSFRCDYLPYYISPNAPLYANTCRVAVQHVMMNESSFNGDGYPIGDEGEEFSLDSFSAVTEVSTPENVGPTRTPREPFDMFPRPMSPPSPRALSSPPIRPFRGPFAMFTLEQVNLRLAARCLELYLSGGSVPMDDPVGQMLLYGYNQFMDLYVEPVVEDIQMIWFDLD